MPHDHHPKLLLRATGRERVDWLTGLQVIWCAPLTLLGIAFWLHARWLSRSSAKIIWDGQVLMLVAHSSLLAKLLARHPMGPMQAMAIGACVLASDAPTLRRCLVHERVHVRQAMRWGPIFVLAYLAASGLAWARGRCPYRGNRYEIEAFAAEAQDCT